MSTAGAVWIIIGLVALVLMLWLLPWGGNREEKKPSEASKDKKDEVEELEKKYGVVHQEGANEENVKGEKKRDFLKGKEIL